MNDSDFVELLSKDKESLIKIVLELREQLGLSRVAEHGRVSLPPIPAVGRYVIRDSLGQVRAIMPEESVKHAQVEGMAILFSLVNEVQIEFQLGGRVQLMSVWKKGREVK
jgi:hypothetical protein